MSKDTPEVGDVYLYKHYKMYVIAVQKDVNCVFLITDGWKYWVTQSSVSKYDTYLGKSKATIDDLFKTEYEK